MILFGASGHCKVVLDILKANQIEISGIYDDNPGCSAILDIPVFQNDLDNDTEKTAIITIGSNEIRKSISEHFTSWKFETAQHPSAIISESASIGEGTVIMPLSAVNSSVNIGNHCIINTGAVVEHDCNLGDFVHISPNAALAGNVEVGEGSHIGIGANVIQGVKIGKWCTIGAGAVIIKDVPDFATVVGNPGKIVKIKTEENL